MTTFKCISGCGRVQEIEAGQRQVTTPCPCGRTAVHWSTENPLRLAPRSSAAVRRSGDPVIVGQQSLMPDVVPNDERSFPWPERVGEDDTEWPAS
jgi:hypothetical protein